MGTEASRAVRFAPFSECGITRIAAGCTRRIGPGVRWRGAGVSAGSPRFWPRRTLALPVRAYRFFLSPWLGSACRFEPTCSLYTLEALDRHGATAGSYLAVRRVMRCHPWCDGGLDPVPPLASSRPSLTKTLT